MYRADQEIRTVFDGVLRMPARGKPRKVRKVLNSSFARYTNRGICGHAWGKSIVRTGRGLKLGIHGPRHFAKPKMSYEPIAVLAHFEGLTPLHWQLKLERYLQSGLFAGTPKKENPLRHRVEQLNYVAACDADPDKVRELHDAIRLLSVEEFNRLAAHGLALPMPVDPMKAVDQYFPEMASRLTVAAFDRSLVTRYRNSRLTELRVA